ncbi:TPA: hypothetical protein ACHV4S_004391, partial [Providencia stuartii]
RGFRPLIYDLKLSRSFFNTSKKIPNCLNVMIGNVAFLPLANRFATVNMFSDMILTSITNDCLALGLFEHS